MAINLSTLSTSAPAQNIRGERSVLRAEAAVHNSDDFRVYRRKEGTEKGPVLGVDYAGEFPTFTAGPSSPTNPQHAISTLSPLSTTPPPWTNCCNGLNNRDNGAAAGYVPSVP